jgi:hypothetical protein
MAADKSELAKLRDILHSAVVEVEMALDTATYSDWTETKENLLKALEFVRRLERDQMWSKLSRK